MLARRLSYIRSVIAAEGVLTGSGTDIYSLGYLGLVTPLRSHFNIEAYLSIETIIV